ncbi:MAG: hypothetical protein F6K48_12640 [Okeania sp. SIO3H1]|nr:hypothetical protein [Okeania sp. SIO3H1]
MVGAAKQIEEKLKEIEVAIAEIAKEFYGTYEGYFKVLGEGIGQQLIFASYHICTQGYPEAFLNLSFSQRQKMQLELREIAKLPVRELEELLEQIPEEQQNSDETSAPELIMSLLGEGDGEEQEVTSLLKDEKTNIEFDSAVLFSTKTYDNEERKLADRIEESLNKIETEEIENSPENIIDKLENLETLISWQENIEKQIPEILKKVSDRANSILQNAEILPNKIPKKVLEAATKMESGETPLGGKPNLLNLLIEAEDPEEEKKPRVTKVMAVNLRLSEIEFTDINVSAWRNKIRNLLGRLNQLQREYRKKQRERAVIEAESAWRSSWYEE